MDLVYGLLITAMGAFLVGVSIAGISSGLALLFLVLAKLKG